MKYVFYMTSLICLTISFFGINIAIAQTKIDGIWADWNWALSDYLDDIRHEYGYYAIHGDDGSYFPETREQEIISRLENKFLREHASEAISKHYNMLGYAPSTNIAKLLLHYGGNVFDGGNSTTYPIIGVASQYGIKLYKKPGLSHDEVRAGGWVWGITIPSNNAIALIKLYLALGADVHATNEGSVRNFNPLSASFSQFGLKSGDHQDNNLSRAYERPDAKHLTQHIQLEKWDEDNNTPQKEREKSYKTPVTYWLEEFIAKDYPASMLDTHKLHYPRFMKTASVAEVMDMLNNSDAHKIPANINCPYKETCPLTPSINMRDAMGRTPLHIAGEQGNKAVFNALIQIGADESVKDYRGNLAGL